MDDQPAAKPSDEQITLAMPLVGTTGLRQTSGFIFEEQDAALEGENLWRILRQMRDGDPVAGAMLFGTEMLCRRTEWTWEPREPGDSESERWADFVSECDEQRYESHDEWLTEALSFLVYGFHLSEIGYGLRRDGRVGWSEWGTRGQETILRWEIDRPGRILGAFQYDPFNAGMPGPRPPPVPIQGTPLVPSAYSRAPGGEVFLPTNRLIHLRTTRHKNNPLGRSVLRNAIEPWWMRRNVQKVEGIGIERNLAGLPVARVPGRILSPSATAEDQATLNGVKAMVTGTRRDEQGGIILPSDVYPDSKQFMWTFELMRPVGTVSVDTSPVIDRYSQQEAMVMLADFLFLGHKGVGSFALADNKSEFFSAGVDAWLDIVAEAEETQAARRLVALNGGDPAKTPRRQHSPVAEMPLESMAKAMFAFAQSGANFWSDPVMARELMQLLATRLGVKKPVTIGKPIGVAAPIQPPTAVGPGGGGGAGRPSAPAGRTARPGENGARAAPANGRPTSGQAGRKTAGENGRGVATAVRELLATVAREEMLVIDGPDDDEPVTLEEEESAE